MSQFSPTTRLTSSLSSTMQKRSPLVFFVLVYILTIPFWLLAALVPIELLPGLPVSAFAVFCPVVAAAILVYRQEKTPGVTALLQRAFDFRRVQSPVWYLVAILVMPVISLLAYGVMRWQQVPVPAPEFSGLGVLSMVVMFFIGGLGEELGWSGYALDPLQARWDALRAALLLGVVGAAWHIPSLLLVGRSASWIAWWALAVVMQRVLQVWVYNNAGKSVFVVTLFHVMINLTWQLFPVNGSHYDPRLTALIALSMAVIVVIGWGPRTLTRERER